LIHSTAGPLGSRPTKNRLVPLETRRPGPLRDLKRRLDQVLAKSPLLLLRSAPGGIVELVARTAQVAGKPWIDLAGDSVEVIQDVMPVLEAVEEELG